MKLRIKNKIRKSQSGFSLPELIIVLLIVAILVVLSLPQIISSRRAFSFSGMQRQMTASLSEARQNAMTQKRPITVTYQDASKRLVISGGSYGTAGDVKNRVVELAGSGLEAGNIIYGRPGGATAAALSDTSNLTPLVSGAAAITFRSDGSVIDAADNPQNNALFFYNNVSPNKMAFAVSVLGAGGRVKLWRYNDAIQMYVE